MTQRVWMAAAAITIGIAGPAAAQTIPEPAWREQEVVVEIRRGIAAQQAARELSGQDMERKMVELKAQIQGVGEMREKMAVEGRTTKGAPYSAEATTESTQTLADGNRIVRKSTTRIYRDGEGRTRREELNDSGLVVSVSIVDPIAGTNVMLQPETRTAYRNQGLFFVTADAKAGGGRGRGGMVYRTGSLEEAEVAILAKIDMEKVRQSQEQGARGRGMVVPTRATVGDKASEDLGRQTVEGVPATGSRTTATIVAGAIGNEQPIKVVSEQWFSPDLQVLVLTKFSDPRQGETTYRLSNIVRAEPDRSLFTVPSDYTFRESGIRQPLE